MDNELKIIVDKISSLMDKMAESSFAKDILGDEKMGELVKIDLMNFAMYLSASDGEIGDEEVIIVI